MHNGMIPNFKRTLLRPICDHTNDVATNQLNEAAHEKT